MYSTDFNESAPLWFDKLWPQGLAKPVSQCQRHIFSIGESTYPEEFPRNSCVSLGRDVLITSDKEVASKLMTTNTANFSAQINKITILVSNLPNFANGSCQNPE